MNVSLCLIVQNEANQLADCVKSFKGLYSSIIIADTGSTDNTKTLAQKLGASVFSYQWEDNFSKARNFLLSKVKTDWILFVDADDRILTKDKTILQQKLKNIKKNTYIISCPYLYTHDENNNMGQIGDRIRFFRSDFGLSYQYPVHEFLQIPKKYEKNHIRIDAKFLHVKTNKNIKKGLVRNCKIMNKYIKKHSNDLRILYYLVHDNYFAKNYKDIAKWADQYMKSKPTDKYQINKVLTRQAISLSHLNKGEKAVQALQKAMKICPDLIEPYLFIGDVFMKNKKYDKAIQFYKFAKECKVPKNSNHFFNTAAYTYHADISLAYALPKIGEYKIALKHAQKAQKYIPKDKKLNSHIKHLKSKI